MIAGYEVKGEKFSSTIVNIKENYPIKDIPLIVISKLTPSEKQWLQDTIGFIEQPKKRNFKALKSLQAKQGSDTIDPLFQKGGQPINELKWIDLGHCRILETSISGANFIPTKVGFYYLNDHGHPLLLSIENFKETDLEDVSFLLYFNGFIEEVQKNFYQHWNRETEKIMPTLVLGVLHNLLHNQVESIERIEGILNKIGSKILRRSPGLGHSNKTDVKLTNKILQTLIKDLGHSQETISYIVGNTFLFNNLVETIASEITEIEGHITVEGNSASNIMNLWQHDTVTIIQFCKVLTTRVEYLSNYANSIINLKQTEGNQTLALIASMFVVPNLITGFLGMNFNAPPNVSWQLGMSLVLCSCVGIAYGTYRYFKSRSDL